nr:hypothetical protein [Tanacetum cinerariifolium]
WTKTVGYRKHRQWDLKSKRTLYGMPQRNPLSGGNLGCAHTFLESQSCYAHTSGNNDEDDAEVINPYEEVDPLNQPPPTSDEVSEFTPPVVPIANANDELIPPVIQFGGNYHVGESSLTGTLLVGNGWVHASGLMGCSLESVHRGVTRLDRQLFDRYKTKKRMAKKFKKDEFRMNRHEYDITALDTADYAKVKIVNEDVYIRALIDGKKIIVTEASIRRDLHLQDAEGTSCLPNDTIFEELARIGIITPLFETMMVQAPEEVGECSEVLTDTHHTPIVTQPSSSQPRRSKNQGGNRGRKLSRERHILSSNSRPLVLELEVLDLEQAKTDQAKEIADLKKRVNKLERKKKLKTSDGDEVIVDATAGEEVEQSTKVAIKEVSTADPVTTVGEVVTTAEDVEKPLNKKDQIAFDEEVARKLEAQMKAEMEEEERIARDKDKANIAVVKQWDEVQAKIDADMELAQKLQTKGQEQLTDAEKATLVNTFVDMNTKIMEERSKKTQAEVAKGSSKRAGDELEQESAKRQRLEKEDDYAELKRCLEIVPKDDNDVTIEATSRSSKSPTIVNYKIYKEGKKSYFKIIRADGNSQSYLTFGKMFKNFNREDLEVL